jgi:hypothetical protein
MREEIRDLVNKIKIDFGSNSIIYEEENPSMEKRLAIWS